MPAFLIAALFAQGTFACATMADLNTNAKIIGPDGRARTPQQHEYWIARHPEQRTRMNDPSSHSAKASNGWTGYRKITAPISE
jgi:hypothetical protein